MLLLKTDKEANKINNRDSAKGGHNMSKVKIKDLSDKLSKEKTENVTGGAEDGGYPGHNNSG